MLKRVLTVATGVGVAALLALALLPAILSTGAGTRLGSAVASRILPGVVHVEQVGPTRRMPDITC